jgi:5-methylthioadenosine/S-adenosylhomocysteine deaminase
MIIAAEWVFPVTSAPLRRHAIVVGNGVIQEIRPLKSGDPSPENTCVIPGFVNAHTHLAYTGLRNFFDDLSFFDWIRRLTETKYKVLTEEDIILSTQLGIAECLRAGITTVADMSDLEPSIKTLTESPLRGIFYWEVFGVEKTAADQTWSLLDENYRRLQKEYSTSRLRIGISPHSCYTVRPELYQKIGNWAAERGVPISFHAAESIAEEDFVSQQKGIIADFLRERTADWEFFAKSSIGHLETTGIFKVRPLIAHAVHASDGDLNILRDYNVPVAHCPKSNARYGHGIAPVHQMLDKGIVVGLGTDSAASTHRLDLFEEGRFAILQQRSKYQQPVLSSQKILEMLTIDGARALNLQGEIGSLEPGKLADMVVVEIPSHYETADQVKNHIIFHATAENVRRTFVSGEAVRYDSPDMNSFYKKIGTFVRF